MQTTKLGVKHHHTRLFRSTADFAIMRRKILLRVASSLPAPPPSPIPNAKGSRSAANSIFSDYVDKKLGIPELDLPEQLHRHVVADIEYESLKSGDMDSVNWIVRSAMQFGSFRISGHDISCEELRSTVTEAESVLGASSECWQNHGDREEFIWSRPSDSKLEWVKKVIGVNKHRNLNQKMEKIACKLEAIAEEVYHVILENNRLKQSQTNARHHGSRLSLFKHKNFTVDDQSPNSSDGQKDSSEYALSLHLPVEHGEFCLESEQGMISFDTDPNTIIFTIREPLEEWSDGEFKCGDGRLYFEPDHASQTSFSFELRFLPSNLHIDINNSKKKISVLDQILIVLFVCVLYKLFV